MKKIALLLLLVVSIPFATIAQKRSKKDTKTTTTTKKVNFMIIKGVEVDMSFEGMDESEILAQDVSLQQAKRHIKPSSKFYFSYDVGSATNKEAVKLTSSSQSFRSMAQAVNASAEYGWEFMNATIVIDGPVKIHYYYMKR
tara:strand:- start:186 stop:608 length:423 start_codon:yes stop_codon:yes gene_type:complete